MSETMYERIRRLRKAKDMSQYDLAIKCGYTSRSAISKIELGDRNLDADKIMAIAKALNVTSAYLMDGDEPNEPEPEITRDNLKFALFGGNATEEQLDEVLEFAKWVKNKGDK